MRLRNVITKARVAELYSEEFEYTDTGNKVIGPLTSSV